MAKEAYLYGKRGLFIWQKRPVYMAEEAYSYGKYHRSNDNSSFLVLGSVLGNFLGTVLGSF